MLEELFKKESFNEADLKIIHSNLERLTHEQKARLGLVEGIVVETPEEVVEIPKKTTTRRKKVV